MSGLLEEVRAARRLPPPEVAKAIRVAAQVSQQQIADELGVCRVTVARWEIGSRSPRGELRYRYTALLEELRAELGAPANDNAPAGNRRVVTTSAYHGDGHGP